MDIFETMARENIESIRIHKGALSLKGTRSLDQLSQETQEVLRFLEGIRKACLSGEYDHEEVAFFFDKGTGLKSIMAVHDSTLGEALIKGKPKKISLGGTRFTSYITPEEKEKGIVVPGEVIVRRAVFDVLRLSRGMTYKSSVAGLNLGGAKGIIIADPDKDKRPVLLYQYGRYVNTFEGRFITGEDMNIKIPDADIMSFATPYVAGLSPDNPRRKGSGDPSPFTARGVFQSMRAVLKELYGTDSFNGIKVAVQGIAGNVGSYLAAFLSEAGAEIIGCGGVHVKKTKAICQKYGVRMLEDRDKIYDVKCDISSPNAGGAILNDETLPRLKRSGCKAIVGGANNQLLKPEHGDWLHEHGILYIPDYVANAGGVINVCYELVEGGYDPRKTTQMVDSIYDTVREIICLSREKNLPTYLVAEEMAKERVRKGTINQGIPKVKFS